MRRARRGGSLAYIYQDDKVSGAEFVKSPGLARPMNTLKPRLPFQVLITSEESPLEREEIETAYLLDRIIDAAAACSSPPEP